MTTRALIPTRADFAVFMPISTRWMDNDAYGHVNNVAYYSWFDSAVNGYLIKATGTDIRSLPQIGVVAETSCRFLQSLSFPQDVEIGLAVTRMGRSSVSYAIGVFLAGGEICSADGRFVHVYVDAVTRTPTAIPAVIQRALAPLMRPL